MIATEFTRDALALVAVLLLATGAALTAAARAMLPRDEPPQRNC